MSKFRFVHLGVAAAMLSAGVVGADLIRAAGAAGSATPSSFVPIVPCRLADTRSGPDHVGPRAASIGAGEVVTFAVWGSNGNCEIPVIATGVATNITAVNPNSSSYLSVYPSDAAVRPTASNLNYVPGAPPTPNQVTVALSATGLISAFNNAGSVDVIIDIVGFYQPASSGTGAPGPTGPTGPIGPAGAVGAAGRSALDPLPSGTTVTGYYAFAQDALSSAYYVETSTLPFTPKKPFLEGKVRSEPGWAFSEPGSTSTACTGTYSTPTAPPGSLCVYWNAGSTNLKDGGTKVTKQDFADRDLSVVYRPAANGQVGAQFQWAYTAP